MSALSEISKIEGLTGRKRSVLIEVLEIHERGDCPSWNVIAYESGSRPQNIDLSKLDLSNIIEEE